jgi:hypothetical protein
MKIRKCIGMCLALLVLVSNTGLAFNVHFCEGVIATVTSAFNTDEACSMKAEPSASGCCSSAKQTSHEDCCKNKLVNLKEKSDKGIVKTLKFELTAPFLIRVINSVPEYKKEADTRALAPVVSAGIHSPPLFKLYSQYLLYA